MPDRSPRTPQVPTVLRIAVSDPLPSFRHGVMTLLAAAGFASEAPEDVLAWARVDEPRMVLFTVRAAADWTALAQMCNTSAAPTVLALLEDASVPSYVRALAAGASGAVPRDAPLDALRSAFEAAVRGDTLLPTAVLRALARPDRLEPQPEAPTVDEQQWLHHLAAGDSVARLAERAGYSERMMFRLLRDLYTKIGAANRTEALIRARDEGWL
ncbi:DNA-binding response regulator [Dactylosporangium sp. CS-047395]|uniref:helix-turn-helix transcriptional regulator n=1 Tax=Dactylosporangium sp. CS-047395 TaxID=3239936 RepID=UPI003D90C8EF